MAGRKTPLAPTESFIPDSGSISALRRAANTCRGCPLFLQATQAVFGEGAAHAQIVLVGEQPGDQEDRAGRPFVGPAGKLLDQALAEAGLERKKVYVTNSVKHFNFEPRGKFRLHKRPPAMAVKACRPWLDAELAAIRPKVVVLLGATAAQAILGTKFRVTRSRGKVLRHEIAPIVVATLHPSAILRAPDEAAREASYRLLVADLTLAAARAIRS